VEVAVVWRTGQSGAPATSPGRWVPTVGASDNGATGQSGGAPDRSCSLSGAPSDACSDSARAVGTVPVHCSRCRRPLALGAVAPLGAPDSPVVHRTGPVHCPVRLLTPALTLRALSALFLFTVAVADDRWRLEPLLRLVHRTVR
jgi:hypothetical protein